MRSSYLLAFLAALQIAACGPVSTSDNGKGLEAEHHRTSLTSMEQRLLAERCEEQELSFTRFQERFNPESPPLEVVKKDFCIRSNYEAAMNGRPSLVTMTPLESYMYNRYKEHDSATMQKAMEEYETGAKACSSLVGLTMIAIPLLKGEHGDNVSAEQVVASVVSEFPTNSVARSDAFVGPLLGTLRTEGLDDQDLAYYFNLFDSCLSLSSMIRGMNLLVRDSDYQSMAFSAVANAQKSAIAKGFVDTESVRAKLAQAKKQ